MKIRSKIIVSLLIVVIVGGTVALFYTNKYSQQALKETIGENSFTLAQQVIDSIDRIVYRRIERWQSFVDSRPRIIELLEESNQMFLNLDNRQEIIDLRNDQWLQASNEQAVLLMSDWTDEQLSQSLVSVSEFYEEQYGYDLFPEVFITNKYGTNIAQSNRTSDYYQADEEWWNQAKENDLFVSDASYDESAMMFSLSLCIAIKDEQGNFLGVIKAILNLEEIFDIINEIKDNSDLMQTSENSDISNAINGSTMHSLINADGKLIYTTGEDDYENLDDVSDHLLEKIHNNDDVKYFVDWDNKLEKDVLYSFAHSYGYRDYKGLGWNFLLKHETDVIYAPVKILSRNLVAVIIVSSILAIAVGYFVSRYITYPIEQLRKSAEIIRKGNLDHRAEISSKDEMGELSRDFDEMTEAIKKSRADVDIKVKQQTKDITRQKEKLEKQQKEILEVLKNAELQKTREENIAQDLQKFKLAVENVSDHIVITDAEGIVLYANKTVESITGFSPKEIIGKKAGSKKMWGGIMKNDFYKKLWKTIKCDKQNFSGEIKNKTKDGREYIAKVAISPIINNKGKVEFFVGIERDITREKQIDKAKTEFVSLASHQLRTPLSAINWFTEMLIAGDAGKVTKKQNEYLKEIYSGNRRMIDLVNALLNVSRLELGTFVIEPVVTDVITLAKSVIDEIKPQIKEKKIQVKEKLKRKITKMNVDPKLMRIVFQNLLSNAVKYTPIRGTIEITVGIDEKVFKMAISDTGMGIPKLQQDKIFTKMFRADNARASDTEGTGLGLYIVKAIMDQSQGKVWFESVEGKGTTFFLTLPTDGMKKRSGTKTLK